MNLIEMKVGIINAGGGWGAGVLVMIINLSVIIK